MPCMTTLEHASPWLATYPDGVPHRFEAPDRSLSDLLDDSAERYGDAVATDFYGRLITYRALGKLVSRVAAGLDEVGVRPGDRVEVILPTVPENVVAFYAILRLGAVCVEDNPDLSPTELEAHLRDNGATTAIVLADQADDVTALTASEGVALRRLVTVDPFGALPEPLAGELARRYRRHSPAAQADSGNPREAGRSTPVELVDWTALADHAPLPADHPRPDPDSLAVIQYTSGTTGTPKGAMISHRNQLTNGLQLRSWYTGFEPGHEVFFDYLPFSHVYGIMVVMVMGVSVGARIVLLPRLSMTDTAEALERARATFLPGVPPIYDALCRSVEHGTFDLHGVKYAMSGAMPLAEGTVDRWVAATGGVIIEGYGMTEVSGASLFTPIDAKWRPGTIGVPLPGTDVRVVDPDSLEPVAVGEAGELLVRGPQVFQGYWNNPAETANVLLADGWLRTGDLVRMAPDGYVSIVDRIKNLIIVGGLKISPTEVERVLLRHPDVADAVVVPRPRPDAREEVAAGLITAPGREIDIDDVRDFARAHLAAYETPRHMVVLPSLPRSGVGKLLRREAAAAVIEALDASATLRE